MILLREGVHSGWEKHRVNCIPSRASRSNLGVLKLVPPQAPMLSRPRSSAMIRITLGLWRSRLFACGFFACTAGVNTKQPMMAIAAMIDFMLKLDGGQSSSFGIDQIGEFLGGEQTILAFNLLRGNVALKEFDVIAQKQIVTLFDPKCTGAFVLF